MELILFDPIVTCTVGLQLHYCIQLYICSYEGLMISDIPANCKFNQAKAHES